jgi:hypothetical protein
VVQLQPPKTSNADCADEADLNGSTIKIGFDQAFSAKSARSAFKISKLQPAATAGGTDFRN